MDKYQVGDIVFISSNGKTLKEFSNDLSFINISGEPLYNKKVMIIRNRNVALFDYKVIPLNEKNEGIAQGMNFYVKHKYVRPLNNKSRIVKRV